MNYKKIINLIQYKGLLLFADSENVYQSKIINLLIINDINFKVIRKKNYLSNNNDKQIIFLKSFSYFLVFFLNRGSKKIVFVAQPFYAISYIFLNRFILACYDCHYGLPKINSIKLFLEEFILKKIESIIHRDLRLWKIYKPTLKTKKNILIPDHLSTNLNNPNLLNKKNYTNITAVVLGWIDDKEVQITETVISLLKLGVKIEFYISEKSQLEINNLKLEIESKYPKQVRFNSFINNKNTIEKISKFHIGICPHSKKYSLINKTYRQYCGSSRIIDYIEAGLPIVVSKTAYFQRYIARSHKAQIIDIFEIEKLKKIEDLTLLLKLKKTEFSVSKKIFNRKFLSDKFIRFIF